MKRVLADTSIWVNHLRSPDALMTELTEQERLLTHTFVIGELSMGHLRDRNAFVRGLRRLDHTVRAKDAEVTRLVEENQLFGLGLSWIDAHLLASTLLMDDVVLWSHDRRLNAAASRFERAMILHH